jgi:hypothetical protein
MTLTTLYLLAAAAGAGATIIVAALRYWGDIQAMLTRWASDRRARHRLARARRRLGRNRW